MQKDEIKRVIVGIDGSSESMHAATVGHFVAGQAKANFQLVHATKDLWVSARRAVTAAASSISASTLPADDTALVESTHARIAADLARELPEGISRQIHVEKGRAGPVLERVAHESAADLIVIGGKHHTILRRWLAGSTAYYLARNARCPVLVTASDAKTFSRILVSLDLSPHSPDILGAGETLAAAVHGALRVVHVVEDGTGAEHDKLINESEESVEKLVQALAHTGTESTVLSGDPWTTIQSQIRHWDADVLVVGSHGFGFENRQLLGRMTEECLDDLPTSTLIVPITGDG